MQSICGKLRSAAKQTFSHLRAVDLKPIASVESTNLGYTVHQVALFTFGQRSSSSLLLKRAFGTEITSLTSSRSGGIAPSLSSYRCLSSSSNQTSTPVSDEASATSDVGPRIKFKRLDKTARHIMQILDKEAVEGVKSNREIPDIRPGYIIQLKVEVPENKRRVSVIKGIVIARRNAGLSTTIRLRRLVAGVGIESLFPLYSPNIKEIQVLEKRKVRRAKLYYLRDKMNALKK